MIRAFSLDGTEYTRLGLPVLPVSDLTDEELDGLLSDTEPTCSAARDSRLLPWEPVPAVQRFEEP